MINRPVLLTERYAKAVAMQEAGQDGSSYLASVCSDGELNALAAIYEKPELVTKAMGNTSKVKA